MTVTAFIADRYSVAVRAPLMGFTKDGRAANGGGLGWTPQAFWAATLAEFAMAVRDPNAESGITQADARAAALAAGLPLFGE
jgi:hypothetical protein